MNGCPGLKPQDPEEELLNRELLNEEFDSFAAPWLRRACKAGQRNESFEAFIYLWVTFNAWLANIITDRRKVEHDAELVRAAGLDSYLSRCFMQLLKEDKAFKETAHEFHRLWPVFKVRALAENGIGSWGSYGHNEDRQKYRLKCFKPEKLQPRDYSPSCFLEHQLDPSFPTPDLIPLDWAHTIRAIYQVRCNLFHGGKGFKYSKDKIFVDLAFKILWNVWGSIKARERQTV